MISRAGKEKKKASPVLIDLTKGSIKYGNLSLAKCDLGMFTRGIVGPTNLKNGRGKEIELFLDGLNETIKTDIPADKKIFRQRSKIREFIRFHKLKVDDKVLLERISSSKFKLKPANAPFAFIDLFAGIGGMRLAFEKAGCKCVFTSEWDKFAQQTYEANFREKPKGDIRKIKSSDIPDHDILVAGFPCQSFSIIGNGKGFADTRGTMFFYIEQILKTKRPKAFLLENVKQFKTHDNGRTFKTVINSLNKLGYYTHTAILNALDYGVPQKRERTFIVGFHKKNYEFLFPKPFNYKPTLDEVLEPDDDIDPKLIASEYIQNKRIERIKKQGKKPFYPSIWHENKGGHIGMHPFSCALRHNASYNYLLVNGKRRLSSRECLRLQGYPDSFKIVVPHSAIRAQAGNSVAVPLITGIALRMIESLKKSKKIKVSLFEDDFEMNQNIVKVL